MSEKGEADSESQACNLALSKEELIQILTRDILGSSVVVEENDSPENSTVASKSEIDAHRPTYHNAEDLLLDACGPTLAGESDIERMRESQAAFDARLRRKVRSIVPASMAESQEIINSAILGLLNKHETIDEIAKRHRKEDDESRDQAKQEARGLIFTAVDRKARNVLRHNSTIKRDNQLKSSMTSEDGFEIPIEDRRSLAGDVPCLYEEAAAYLVDKLSETERKVLVGMLSGLDDTEIAVQIDRDQRTVRRAKTKLREILTNH